MTCTFFRCLRAAALWLPVSLGFGHLAAAAPAPPQFTELGHDYPTFSYGGTYGFAVGDFDGDGREDFAFASPTGENGFWALFVVGKNAAGTMIFKQQSLVPDTSVVRTLLVRQAVGAPHVVTLGADGTVRDYAGWPLAETQHFATLDSPSFAAAGDVFGDGVPRIAVRSASALGVYAVATGAQEWVRPSSGAGDLLLAQLDADPELEIVVGGDSAPGLVLDGLSGTIDWSYPDRFGALAAGPLGPNHETQFVGLSTQVTVFSGAPYSPLWDFSQGLYFSATSLTVGDVTGDGRAEILLTVPNDQVRVIDAATHLAHALGASFQGPLAFIDLDGNAGRAFLYSDSPAIGIATLENGTSLWEATSRFASFSTATAADLDRDGRAELLTGYDQSIWSYTAAGLQVRSMATGATLAALPPPYGGTNDPLQVASARILVNADRTDRAPQIVLAGTTVYDGRVTVLDGQSHATTLQLGSYADGPFYSRSISDAALIDVDGDGARDIVAATQPALSWVSGAKLQCFSMAGQTIWESVGMGSSYDSIYSVFALSADSGAGDVVVAVLGSGLRAYGRLSHLLLWTTELPTNGAVVIAKGDAGVEIAVEDGPLLTFLDASTRVVLRTLTLPDQIDAIAPLEGSVHRLLVSSGGALHLIDGVTGVDQASTSWLGSQIAARNQLAVETLGGGRWHIGAGGAIGVYRYALTTDALFDSGFEIAVTLP